MKMRRLNYGNVMSTLAVFLVLAGGTAFAASQLAKNSVGTKQLKKNSVTAKKIKKNAVTAAKIKKNAVTAAKITNGAVTGQKIDPAGLPVGQIVAKLRGATPVGFSESSLTVYPLTPSTYTQNADEANELFAYLDVTYAASCAPPRGAAAILVLDSADPLNPQEDEVVGLAQKTDETSGEHTTRLELASSFPVTLAPLTLGSPSAPTARKLSLVLVGSGCKSGSGVTATGGGVDVIGIR